MAYPPTSPNVDKPPVADAAATGAQSPTDPLVPLKFTPEFIEEMFKEIADAQKLRDDYATKWDILIKEYIPDVIASGQPESIKSNIHFRDVHTKLAQIFYQNPELILEAKMPVKMPVMMNAVGQPMTAEDAITVKREVLNYYLGDDGIDASWLMDELLTDALMWSGNAAVKIGCKIYTKPVTRPVMIPDPNFIPPQMIPGQVLGLGASVQPPMVPATTFDPETMQQVPKMETVIVPIFKEWYANRVPPKKMLWSKKLKSGRFDRDACWVGQELFMSKRQLVSTFNVTEELLSHINPTGEDTLVADQGGAKPDSTDKSYHIYELFLKANEYDDAQPHPLAIYQLVLIEGMKDKPIVYRPCVDQTFDEFGQLTPDSLVGFPIEFLSLRDMPDSPFVYSDAAMVNNQIKQINTHRRQSAMLRDAAIARMMYDQGAFTPTEIEAIKQMKVGDWIGVQEGKLSQGPDKIVAPMTQPTASRDDYRLAAMLKQDLDEALGLSAQEAGATEEGNRTATEVATVGAKAAARLGKDRQRATKCYLRIVRKLDTYLMRYATTDDYITIVGPLGEKRMEIWNNKIITGRYAYKMKPDSQLMIDAARDRQQLLTYAEKVLMDPMINRVPIHRKLATLFGLDPSEVVMDPMTAKMAQMSGLNTGTPGENPGGGTRPQGDSSDRRPHDATGGRPNAPDGASPVAPNVGRPNAA